MSQNVCTRFILHIAWLKILNVFQKMRYEKLYKKCKTNSYRLVLMTFPILKMNNRQDSSTFLCIEHNKKCSKTFLFYGLFITNKL